MDEFIIDRSKLKVIDKLRQSIEERFDVNVVYCDVVKDEGTEKQWIAIRGDDREKKKEAREYMKTVCNADEKLTMQFPEYLTPILSKPGNYQKIEEQSGAVILFFTVGEIDILGNDISVTLAMSAVEDFVSQYEIPTPDMPERSDRDGKRGDVRLDTQLKLVCGKHDLPYEDYCNTPSSVKRTLLSWLSNDMDNTKETDIKLRDDVVADSPDGADDSVVIVSWREVSPTGVITVDTPEPKKTEPKINLFGNANNLTVGECKVSPVGEMTNVFQKTLCDVGKDKEESPTVQSLRQFAVSRGYSNTEVDEVLAVNPNLRLSTIITALHDNRMKNNDSKSEPMDVEPPPARSPPAFEKYQDLAYLDPVASLRDSSPKPGTSATDSGAPIGARSSSPDSKPMEENKDTEQPNSWAINQDYDTSVFKYFQRLSKDFTEESHDSSREDLLKNNAERQQILKEAYEKAHMESVKADQEKQNQAAGAERDNTSQKRPSRASRKKQRSRRNRKLRELAAAAAEGEAAPKQEEPVAGTSTATEEEEEESSEDDDTPDVVVEAEVIRVVPEQERRGNEYLRSPRAQSPQNPKKARQDYKNERSEMTMNRGKLNVNGAAATVGRGASTGGVARGAAGSGLGRAVTKALDSGSGQIEAARPRHNSGNAQHSRTQNTNGRQPRMQAHIPPLVDYRYVRNPPAAATGVPYGQQMAGRPAPRRQRRLRPIVIDGSNVACSHGKTNTFSCRGIEIAINHFLKRGHKEVTAFVPRWRQGGQNHAIRPTVDREILNDLEKKGYVSFTPSRYINGKKVTSYDDRFIVELAAENDGVIVSNDNFRDLLHEKPKWKDVITQRLLMYTFAGNHFMVPDDPMGQYGPTLNQLLELPDVEDPACDRAGAAFLMQPPPNMPRQPHPAAMNPRFPNMPQTQRGTLALPRNNQNPPIQRNPPQRSLRSPQLTETLSTQLLSIFPDMSEMVERILNNHPQEEDLNKLSAYILDATI